MTDHIKTKHKIKNIGSKVEFDELIDKMILSETEKTFMIMYYKERKDLDYIADVLGYSRARISKIHRSILKRVETLL